MMSANFKSFWGKLIHSFVLLIMLGHLLIPTIAIAAQCVKTGSVCAEGPATRTVDGYSTYQPCWRYEDTYQCTETVGVKSCDTLSTTNGCGQTFIECASKDANGVCISFTRKYMCNTDFKAAQGGTLPAGVIELPATHQITSEWDNTECDAKTSTFGSCQNVDTQCVDGVSEKVINGVTVSFPCWKESRSFQCLGKATNTTCDETELNNKCTLKQSNCITTVNGVCQTGENVYTCTTKEGSTTSSDSCKDKDFGKVMAGMEGAREFARYFDESTLTFFKGDESKCTVKLGGVIGGDCCKAAGEPNKWTDAAISAGASYALTSLASGYTYTVLLTGASSAMASVAAGATAIGLGTSVTPSIATYGVGASVSSTGAVSLMVNPVTLVAAIAVYVITKWLECKPDDRKTALRNKAGICHHVGSYCDQKILGVCVTKAQSYCCYVSKLAKIINEQGRFQINKPFVGKDGTGTDYSVEHPNCTGFTEKELGGLDFSKMDLTEFIADLVHITPDNVMLGNKSEGTANTMLDSTKTGTNYYGP